MSNELWLPVPGFESKYSVSSEGRVLSFHTGQMKTPYYTREGYASVALFDGPRRKNTYIHRAVAEAFYGPAPTPSHVVDHINADRADNRLGNLEWVTRLENLARTFRQPERISQ